jgi:hypothetical protein
MFVNIKAPAAWDVTKGGAITIAVVSTGVDSVHEDLAANIVPGWNFLDNNSNTTDTANHGTFLAGTVAALTNNARGVAGTCWNCKVMPLKVSNSGNSATDSLIAQALLYAKDKGVRIAVIGYPVTGRATVETAAAAFVAAGGTVFVPSGNDGLLASTPNSPSMVTLSGTSTMDGMFLYSNTGPYVDLAAPAYTISTVRGNSYGSNTGTPFAAAYAAGVAALVKTLNPNCAGTALVNLLQQSADDLGVPGYDTSYGYGRLNASRAVAAAAACSGGGGDTAAPSVTLTAPSEGASVSGTVSMTATASDNVGVARVEFKVDGTLKCSDTTSPYGCSWDTAGSTSGSHTASASAFDAAGNTATDSNAVTVSNLTPPAAPSGLAGSVVCQIGLSWADNANNETGFKVERCTGVGCANFSQIATVSATSYSDTGTSPNSYTYRVRAYNTAGDSAYSGTASVACAP